MRASRGAVAMACVADLHLWHRPPPCRANEPDWYKAMERPLDQIRWVTENANGDEASVPLAYAGDIFDRWNPPPELISWAIKKLPPGFAVPGQHDLPYHRYEDVRKSAYWTLVQAGVIRNLHPGRPAELASVRLWGFPWGEELCEMGMGPFLGLDVAIIHHYVWCEGKSHPEASATHHFRKVAKLLGKYQAAFFGDNHLPFSRHAADQRCWLVNCGNVFRRRTDEADHRASVCLLHEQGGVSRIYLDQSGDVFTDKEHSTLPAGDAANFEMFLQTLQSLGGTLYNYRDALLTYMDQREVPNGVRRVILKALEASDED